MIDIERQADFLAAVRAAAQDFGLVVNARVDTFLHFPGTPAERIDNAVRRGQRYKAAGADCVYPILCEEPQAIRILVQELGSVNILASPTAPGIEELAALGVARISWGSSIHRAVLAHHAALLAELVQPGGQAVADHRVAPMRLP
jgi:2-methylisocitrate lyase-like PEP mutase family enzyme